MPPYKLNDGNMAYTCGRCLTIMATGFDAVGMREAENEYKMPLICEDCTAKEAEDIDPNDREFDAARDKELENNT